MTLRQFVERWNIVYDYFRDKLLIFVCRQHAISIYIAFLYCSKHDISFKNNVVPVVEIQFDDAYEFIEAI